MSHWSLGTSLERACLLSHVHRFLEAHSKEEIDSLVDEFIALVEKGDEAAMAAAGWPKSMYGVSKLAISSYCHLLAGRVEPRGVRVAACCPG